MLDSQGGRGGNFPPTDIWLDDSELDLGDVDETESIGTVEGTLTAIDPDFGDTHMFSLVAGAGDTDNAPFQIVGTDLKTNAVFDYQTTNSYSIRIQASDDGGLFLTAKAEPINR